MPFFAAACRNKYTPGDYGDGSQTLIGYYSDESLCIFNCIIRGANGITRGSGSSDCYCNFGLSWIRASSYWKTAYIRACVNARPCKKTAAAGVSCAGSSTVDFG